MTPLAVLVTLKDFAIITYAVQPELLERHIPEPFELEVRELADGTASAFISAVTFWDCEFRLRACPWPRFAFGQTNYRAYILHEGQRAGWFFGTSLATPFVQIPRHLWQLSWHPATMEYSTSWTDGRCSRYNKTTRGAWGTAEIELEGTSEPTGCLDGFATEEDTAAVITHPLVAYYRRRDGKIGTYSVWHERLHLQRAVAHRASFEVFHQLGLTTPDTRPHSVLLQQSTDFTILLPPRLFGGYPK